MGKIFKGKTRAKSSKARMKTRKTTSSESSLDMSQANHELVLVKINGQGG